MASGKRGGGAMATRGHLGWAMGVLLALAIGAAGEEMKWTRGLEARPGASFAEALERVRTVVLGGDAAQVEVSGARKLAGGGRTRLGTWGGREVAAPLEECWVFMIDDEPLANWAHRCRYVFVARDLSAIAVQKARTPLSVQRVSARGAAGAEEMEKAIPFAAPPAKKRDGGGRGVKSAIRYDGSVSNCHAAIISGGFNKANNHVRYWGDASFVYSTLTLKYGYPKENVHALVSDGLDPAVDRSDDTDSPADLDGDGLADVEGAATAVNVSNLFATLQAQLGPEDQLFVFLTDHGSPTADGGAWDVELNLWNEEVLKDHELRALTEGIGCPIFFAMEQCHSGGFVDDLGQAGRATATAARHDESSYAGDTYPQFNQWAYSFTAALRGYYPQPNAPWLDEGACDGDLNGDGYVSFREASDFAFANKYVMDNPTYGENPEGLGKQTFPAIPRREDLGLGEFVFDAIDRQQVEGEAIPVRMAAQNVFGDAATNYAGAVELEIETTPIDPGEYVGEGDGTWEYPLYTYYEDARTQVIYPPETMGGARTMDHVELHVVSPPTHSLSNWTVRMKHTALREYPTNAVWESEGWTVVFQSNLASAATGWVEMAFAQAFEYDGTNSLMVDFSYNNDGYADSGTCRAGEATGTVSITYASDSADGDPLDWAGTTPAPELSATYPQLRFGGPLIPVEIELSPTQLVGWAHGEWTGGVAAQGTNARVRLLAADATNGAWRGSSEWFSVRDYRLEFVGNPLNPVDHSLRLRWNSGTGRTYRVLATTNLLEGFSTYATNEPATPPQNTFDRTLEGAGFWSFMVEEE